MDLSFLGEFLKVLLLLPVVLLLIYITFKYGGKYMGKMNNGKIIKVHERVPLSQNSFLSIITIGDKPYLITNGEKGAQILLELDEKLIAEYQLNNMKQNYNLQNMNLASYLDKIKGKVKNEKIQ